VLHGSSPVLTSGGIYGVKKKALFDRIEEHSMAPNELSGDQLLQQLMNVTHVQFGKGETTRKRKRTPNELNWTKKSIFF
jgi:hypothetical protein